MRSKTTTPQAAGSTGPGPARRRRGPSIGDVAKHAGVSAQTVSRVSTGAENVRPETKQRVLDSMHALGYSPNIAARALRNGAYGALGLIAHQLSRTGETRTVEAVVEAARERGYNIVLVDVEMPTTEHMSAAVRRLTHQSIDGLIVIRAETSGPASLSLPTGLPVAVADSRLPNSPGVDNDQAAGARAAVEHLLELGHRHVLHVAGPEDSGPAKQRENAWHETLMAAGLVPTAPLRGDWSAKSGYDIGRKLAARMTEGHGDAPTAVFVANDEMAIGLTRSFQEAGISIPHDVSVVGFDGLPFVEYLWPPLTTVKQDFSRVGRELVRLVTDQLEGKVPTETRMLIPTELVVRGSTAPPSH